MASPTAPRSPSAKPPFGRAPNANVLDAPCEPVGSLLCQVALERCLATAVICKDRSLTYRQLMDWAEGVRARLAEAAGPAGKETRVGIMMPRSCEMAVAYVAAMLGGYTVVPLDPKWPEARLAYVAEHAGLGAVLVAPDHDSSRAPGAAAAVPVQLAGEAPRREGKTVAARVLPDEPAMVLYVSGSAGQPKGVVVSHRALNWRVFSVVSALKVGSRSRALQTYEAWCPSFADFFWAPLSQGGSVLLPPSASPSQVEDFGKLFELADSCTHVGMAPTALSEFLKHGVPKTLQCLCIRGGPVPAKLVQTVFEITRRPMYVQVCYSSAESGDVSYQTINRVQAIPEDDPDVGALPVGKPQCSQSVSVVRLAAGGKLAQPLELCDVDEVGEVVVTGPALAAGYFREPGHSKEAFLELRVPGAFTAEPALRTGDLGKWRSSGALQLVGRRDRRVKLHGLRVELGEVEAVLLGFAAPDGARAAAAVCSVDGDGALVASVAPEDFAELHWEGLAAWCAGRLPAHMVPQQILGASREDAPATTAEEGSTASPAATPTPAARTPLSPLSPRFAASAGPTPRLAPEAPALSATQQAIREAWGEATGGEEVRWEARPAGVKSAALSRFVSLLRKRSPAASAQHILACEQFGGLAAWLDNLAGAAALDEAQGAAAARAPRVRPDAAWRTAQALGTLLALAVSSTAAGGVGLLLVWTFSGPDGWTVSPWNMALVFVAAQCLQRVALAYAYIVAKTSTLGVVPMGEHLMYGQAHFRFWLWRRLHQVCLGQCPAVGGVDLLRLLDGTRLSGMIYRLLGCKCAPSALLDIHGAGGAVWLPEFVQIGAGSCLNDGVQVRPFSFHRGVLAVAPVTVGRDCHVGAGCVLMPGSAMGDGAMLAPRSVLHAGVAVPPGEVWAGNPAMQIQGSPYTSEQGDDPLALAGGPAGAGGGKEAPLLGAAVAGSSMSGLHAALGIALVLAALTVATKEAAGWAVCVLGALPMPVALVLLPLCAVWGNVCMYCIVVAAKLALLGTGLQAGSHALGTPEYAYIWAFRQLLGAAMPAAHALERSWLYRTWLEYLGCRFGDGSAPWAPCRSGLLPGLVDVGANVALGGGCILGTGVHHRGRLVLGQVRLEDGAAVGAAAYLRPGMVLEKGSLLGAISAMGANSPVAAPAGTSWLGAPALQMAAGAPAKASLPSQHAASVAAEVALLTSLEVALLAAPCLAARAHLGAGGSLLGGLVLCAAASLLCALAAAAACAAAAAAARAFRGDRHSAELASRLLAWADRQVLGALRGSEAHCSYLSLLGAEVGAGAYVEAAVHDPGQMRIGPGAVLMDGVVLETWSPEGAEARGAPIAIGQGAHVDFGAVLLPGTRVAAGASIGPLSASLPGEEVPPGSWAGSPLDRVLWFPPPLPGLEAAEV